MTLPGRLEGAPAKLEITERQWDRASSGDPSGQSPPGHTTV